jgi:hypothetical protein
VENGRKEPTLELLRKYETLFDIPMSSIMFFSENIGADKSHKKAKAFVASKIIKLMKFLEERTMRVHVG